MCWFQNNEPVIPSSPSCSKPDIEVKGGALLPGPINVIAWAPAKSLRRRRSGQKLKRDGAAFPAHPLLLFAREHCLLYGHEYLNLNFSSQAKYGTFVRERVSRRFYGLAGRLA